MKWINACAAYDIAFGLFHLAFWKLFDWKHALSKLDTINRAIMQILNLRLTYLFFGVGVLCLIIARNPQNNLIYVSILSGMCGFWVLRAGEQIYFFGVKNGHSNLYLTIFLMGAFLHGFASMQLE